MLQAEVYDSITGQSILPLEPAAAFATRRMTGAGLGVVVFQLADLYDRFARGGMDFAAAKTWMRDSLFKARRRMIAFHDGGSLVPYAGFIMKRGTVDDAAGTLTLDLQEFRLAASWRMTSGVGNIQDANLVVKNVSPQAALRAILDRMINMGGIGGRWGFPVDLTALSTAAGSLDVDAQWYDSKYIEDLLQELEEKGYEIDFNPVRLASGSLSIVPRIAETIQSSAVSDFSVSAAKSAITKLAVTEDHAVQFTGVLGAGIGSGSDTVFSPAFNPPDTGIPFSDVRRDFIDLRTEATVGAAAQAELTRYLHGVEQWSFEINLDAAGLSWEHVQIGRRIRLDVRGHWWIPDGQYVKRVIAATPTLGSGTVQIEVQ